MNEPKKAVKMIFDDGSELDLNNTLHVTVFEDAETKETMFYYNFKKVQNNHKSGVWLSNACYRASLTLHAVFKHKIPFKEALKTCFNADYSRVNSNNVN